MNLYLLEHHASRTRLSASQKGSREGRPQPSPFKHISYTIPDGHARQAYFTLDRTVFPNSYLLCTYYGRIEYLDALQVRLELRAFRGVSGVARVRTQKRRHDKKEKKKKRIGENTFSPRD
jgi:hypothetical protein